VFMLAVNLVIHYGISSFFDEAHSSGVSGVIIPDLDLDAASEYVTCSQRTQVALINLVSLLCEPQRLKKIVLASSGFVYLISSLGITGERTSFSDQLLSLTAAIKAVKPIAVGVGFGISQPEHIKAVHGYADAAIVGSHLINLIDQNRSNPAQALEVVKERISILQCSGV
jgi:tryptophan synthase alpha chain